MLRRDVSLPVRVQRFDGQRIWLPPLREGDEPRAYYEFGGYLGGGNAGVVYEATRLLNREDASARASLDEAEVFAVKELNPIGYRMMAQSALSRCKVAVEGLYRADPAAPVRPVEVWWVYNSATRSAIAATCDVRGNIRELTLPQCLQVFGPRPPGLEEGDVTFERSKRYVMVDDDKAEIPAVPAKYLRFLRARATIFREIRNMAKVSDHRNILKLVEVLELVQSSKYSLFLVTELAAGGELFDRIRLDCGTEEDLARRLFRQLLAGVRHCHERGVCHRDLKPENLLLASDDAEDAAGSGPGGLLKIADFGFSALLQGGGDADDWVPDPLAPVGLKRLRSVVGSPYYVAPEVLGVGGGGGYDGAKADVFSLGVILFAMLAGTLPFGKDPAQCQRFRRFSEWILCHRNAPPSSFPHWLFPPHLSLDCCLLLAKMLHPDPARRISVAEAQQHTWMRGAHHPPAAPPAPPAAAHIKT